MDRQIIRHIDRGIPWLRFKPRLYAPDGLELTVVDQQTQEWDDNAGCDICVSPRERLLRLAHS